MPLRQPPSHDAEFTTSERAALRVIAALFREHQAAAGVHREGYLAGFGLSAAQNALITGFLDSRLSGTTAGDLQNYQPPSPTCPIPWRPNLLTPVFWGCNHFEPGTGDLQLPPGSRSPSSLVSVHTQDLRVPVTVYYPTLGGTPNNAPFLAECGNYPVILFLHGYCGVEKNHIYRWTRMLAQLAASGFVVVAPYISDISNIPVHEALNALNWVRTHWFGAQRLQPEINTGVVGHSYGALLAARVAISVPLAAYVSLSGRWDEWEGLTGLPFPQPNIRVPSMYAWGNIPTGGVSDALQGGNQVVWDMILKPKHKVVLMNGDHWVYLQGQTGGCSPPSLINNCNLLAAIAGDLVASFFSKYLAPSGFSQISDMITDDLIPPEISLTTDQNFYAGSHQLYGLRSISQSQGCQVRLAWETLADSGSETIHGSGV